MFIKRAEQIWYQAVVRFYDGVRGYPIAQELLVVGEIGGSDQSFNLKETGAGWL